MKKFLKVRNIIIILIVIVAIGIIAYIRQTDVTTSKAYQYLDKIDLIHYHDHNWGKKYICTLEDKKENTYKEIYAYEEDTEKVRAIEYLDRYCSKEFLMKDGVNADEVEEDSQTDIRITNMENLEISEYILNNDIKTYLKVTDPNENDVVGNGSYFYRLQEQVRTCDQYIRGFELIDGKLLYVERFETKDEGTVKIYIEDDKIKYIKYDDINLLELSIEEDKIPEQWLEIPSDYKDEEVVLQEMNN